MFRLLLSITVLFASNLIFHQAALSQMVTGTEIYEDCKTEATRLKEVCLGYTMGLLDGTMMGTANVFAEKEPSNPADVTNQSITALGFCIPPDTNREQVMDVFTAYLQNNPSQRDRTAAKLFLDSMRSKYPCEKQ